jgi:hypothetical protein
MRSLRGCLSILIGCAGAAHAQGGDDVRGELRAEDRIHARQALAHRFGRELAASYRLVADGCIVPDCTDVQRRTAVYVREAAPLGALRREQEVHCSAPPGSSRGWTCGLPDTHVFLPTLQGVVRASVARDVDEPDVLRLAAYLRSDCNQVATAGSMSVHRPPGPQGAPALWVWVGLKTFTLQASQADADCPLRIERTGHIVI